MASESQAAPTTKTPHFATLLVMALAPEEVGARIYRARKAKGWTHEQFRDEISARLAIPRLNLRTVQRWQKGIDPKTGKSWLPRLATLMEIADLLDVPRSYFVEEEAPLGDHAVVERFVALEAGQAEIAELLAELLRRLPDDAAGPEEAQS